MWIINAEAVVTAIEHINVHAHAEGWGKLKCIWNSEMQMRMQNNMWMKIRHVNADANYECKCRCKSWMQTEMTII